MRASARAFEVMAAKLERVRRAGIPFGFIFTLTQFNLHELNWVARFALEQGARLLQIHPLEEVGRAQALLQGAAPDEVETSYAYVEVQKIRAVVEPHLYIQFDLVDRGLMGAEPGRFFAGAAPAPQEWKPLSEVISPLVIEPDGTVVPLQFGFARAYALGNIKCSSLRELSRAWQCTGLPPFLDLCRRTFEQLSAPAELPFVNWYELVAQNAAVSNGRLTGSLP